MSLVLFFTKALFNSIVSKKIYTFYMDTVLHDCIIVVEIVTVLKTEKWAGQDKSESVWSPSD